mmetsp:Transcript_7500/g.19504  ORF Transcript_7500/g.19504 Transcript_7500/m.19504 type:complete len:80 (-) Transcript_7500:113-352(-)
MVFDAEYMNAVRGQHLPAPKKGEVQSAMRWYCPYPFIRANLSSRWRSHSARRRPDLERTSSAQIDHRYARRTSEHLSRG